jgi:hypothetical protein
MNDNSKKPYVSFDDDEGKCSMSDDNEMPFGGCPVCGGTTGNAHMRDKDRSGRESYWCVCDVHRTRWCRGVLNTPTPLPEMTAEWRERAKEVEHYTVVEPIYEKLPF